MNLEKYSSYCEDSSQLLFVGHELANTIPITTQVPLAIIYIPFVPLPWYKYIDYTFRICRIQVTISHSTCKYAVTKLSPLLNVQEGDICHLGREEDLTNCLPARDLLSANEYYCIILKKNKLKYSLPK